MQENSAHYRVSIAERRDKVAAALAMLQSLKNQVSELRERCEALKNMQLEKQNVLTCNECGKPIARDQEVTLKDSYRTVKGYYHKDCFKAIWLSQTWIFDYSHPGFLRIAVKKQ